MTFSTPHRDRTPGTPTDAERITIVVIVGLTLFVALAYAIQALT